ncbi:hypothetical protein IV102_16160 [bacterium]|nr:hypothetical protein [bacterium]
MRRILLGLALGSGAWADKVEGTLVQVQRALGTRVILCLKEGDAPTLLVSADLSQCQDIDSRGLGNRWTLFCNRDAQGMLVMTSASSLGPDTTLGPAFALVKQQVKAFADEKWSRALYNLAPDGRPPLATFSEEWKGTLLSDDPADWQVMCSNANRLTVMVNGTHASASGYRRGGYPRRSSAQIDCQLQGGRWVIASMRP